MSTEIELGDPLSEGFGSSGSGASGSENRCVTCLSNYL